MRNWNAVTLPVVSAFMLAREPRKVVVDKSRSEVMSLPVPSAAVLPVKSVEATGVTQSLAPT